MRPAVGRRVGEARDRLASVSHDTWRLLPYAITTAFTPIPPPIDLPASCLGRSCVPYRRRIEHGFQRELRANPATNVKINALLPRKAAGGARSAVNRGAPARAHDCPGCSKTGQLFAAVVTVRDSLGVTPRSLSGTPDGGLWEAMAAARAMVPVVGHGVDQRQAAMGAPGGGDRRVISQRRSGFRCRHTKQCRCPVRRSAHCGRRRSRNRCIDGRTGCRPAASARPASGRSAVPRSSGG